MSKNQKASGITNIISYDNSGNISFVSGSTTLMSVSSSGAVLLTNTMSGGVAVSASLSANSNLLQGTGSVGFSTTASLLAVSSSQQQISSSLLTLTASYTALSSSYTALSASYNTFSGSASTRVTQIESTYATTGSNSFRANQSITGSLVVSSTITAQTLVVQTVTSSIVYSSGSNNFGNQLSNTQTFTGSIQASGSSTHFFLGGNVGIGTTNPSAVSTYTTLDIRGNTGGAIKLGIPNSSNTFNLQHDGTDAYLNNVNSGSMYFYVSNAAKMFISGSGNVGINTTNPTVKLQINGQSSYEPMMPGAATGSFAVNAGTGLYGLYIASRVIGDTWMQVGRNDGTATAYNLLMQVNGGNVGIGKVSPVAKLDVAGEGRFTDMQVTGSAGSKVSIYSNYSGGNPGMSFFNTAGTEVIWLNAANASVNASAFYIGTTARNYLSAGAFRVTSAGDNASTLDISVSNGTTNINSNYYSGGGDNTIIIGTYANYTNQLVLKSNGRIGIGNTNPAFTLDVNGGIRTTGLAIINNYSGTYTTDSSWTSFQTVIPHNTLNQYETYLVELNWTYASPTFAPYYASAAFLFRPVPTNASSFNNAIGLQTSCHVGGDYIITVAQQNVSNASCGGLAAKLSWSTASPSYITVTAKRIAIP